MGGLLVIAAMNLFGDSAWRPTHGAGDRGRSETTDHVWTVVIPFGISTTSTETPDKKEELDELIRALAADREKLPRMLGNKAKTRSIMSKQSLCISAQVSFVGITQLQYVFIFSRNIGLH
ncbi:hypothetical protein KIN20_007471 [Parelaphostrongylus tenuis]|uniref:Uncharacterized protein n=1 Tax=Parelaphostrongylus tenuis TaxID=148309 RepID=A0AAD5QHX1_PARTN|nr:hypothetical protein KIN20_007471 [Parelaphostrongylus tenuis]